MPGPLHAAGQQKKAIVSEFLIWSTSHAEHRRCSKPRRAALAMLKKNPQCPVLEDRRPATRQKHVSISSTSLIFRFSRTESIPVDNWFHPQYQRPKVRIYVTDLLFAYCTVCPGALNILRKGLVGVVCMRPLSKVNATVGNQTKADDMLFTWRQVCVKTV